MKGLGEQAAECSGACPGYSLSESFVYTFSEMVVSCPHISVIVDIKFVCAQRHTETGKLNVPVTSRREDGNFVV